ncbi:acyltransferase [Emticicia aquatilis]|uniref:Acyltransferase n=1 Tax=Emticicia aquatilis TaxID=1537369 RepID=A0A917DID5_9BACT|nr:acyltransferase family protein [Emticicia aquatilis]GGD41012.1 acyltransferase [Emticicia aquatilis]
MKRRYDIDWIRVIAIVLLLIYHTAIGFQPWGGFIGFITNAEPWDTLWIPMTMLNVWRIPILFYVSGMGLYLAIQNRNLKQVFVERFLRIGLPLIFGSVAIVPFHLWLLQLYYQRDNAYLPNMGHLWFLGNILFYVTILLPIIFFFKNRSDSKIRVFCKKTLSTSYSLAIVIFLFVLETLVSKPMVFEMYAFTLHGLLLGMLAFISGFLFMLGGEPFWKMLLKWRWLFIIVAVALFSIRTVKISEPVPHYLLAIESNCWIFSMLAFAHKYLNKNSRQLKYLKDAAYPVYIIHMVFLYMGSILLFPLKIDVAIKYLLLLFFTIGGSLAFYEFFIKRINWTRPLFGLKYFEKNKIIIKKL